MKRKEIIELARRCVSANALIADTETTGLGPEDKIVEIAIIDTAGTFEFSALVDPSKPIPAEAIDIHGITDEMVSWAESASRIWPAVFCVIAGRTLLTYNKDFDLRMIIQTFGAGVPQYEFYCLMNMWMEFHGLARWKKLDDACRHIGVPVGGHRAMGDAKAAREVLRWLARQEV